MARLIIRVKHCLYDATEFGSTEQVIVSRVFYEMSVNGKKRGEFSSDIIHRMGTAPDPESLEVTRPYGYTGPFDHAVFSHKLIAYYQEMLSRSVGTSSTRITVTPRRPNHRLIMPTEFEVQIADPDLKVGRPSSFA